jgi:hypothetical protein
MQTKQTTGLRCAANDYVTILVQASAKISGFDQLYKDMERSISVSGKSRSTLTNYGRQLAHLALHYNCLPTELRVRIRYWITCIMLKQGNSITYIFQVYRLWYALCLQITWPELFAIQPS